MLHSPLSRPTRRISFGVSSLGGLIAASLIWATCTHPQGAKAPPTSSTGGTVSGSGGGSPSGGNSGTGGGVIILPDGGADDAGPVVKAACADDPNQQKALPFTPGYVISDNDRKAAADTVKSMSMSEQIDQLHGEDTSTDYNIFSSPTKGSIKGFQFRDGPRGVNLDAVKGSGQGYSTAFPSASSRGATFDLDLENKVGRAMGDELIASGATMLLAPTVNILRHPAWARAQETYGEDSFLLGRLGSAFTVGVQEFAPACVKHYAANNIDHKRETVTSIMDEQTLQEVYARHFGMIIQDAGVACVMAAYNLVQVTPNGTAKNCTQHAHLLTDILKKQYGFQGMILSDWWAMPGFNSIRSNDPQASTNAKEAILAGLDMELPWYLQYKNLATLASGSGVQPAIAEAARRVVETKFRFHVNNTSGALGLAKPTTTASNNSIQGNDAHIALAEQAAIEGTVLLKNDKSALPIKTDGSIKSVAVIGPSVGWTLMGAGAQASGTVQFADDARMGDRGSSRVNTDPAKTVGPCAGIKAQAPANVSVTCGNGDAGKTAAKNADFVVIVAGLTPEDEGEDYTIQPEDSDRDASLALDGKKSTKDQNAYIMSVLTDAAAAGKPTVVILEGGSAIDVPWLANTSALVMAWYPGQAGGSALGKLLFGRDKATSAPVTFSGKLPISWPASLADEPPWANSNNTANMGYYLGYRWFDTQNKKPLFPFGAGLSYAKFSYSNLQVPCSTVTAKGVVPVTVDVKNDSAVDGDEIVMVFVSYPDTKVPNRGATGYKELKGFARVPLKAGQAGRVQINLRVSDLWYYDTAASAQKVESGMVKVMVGGSSDNLPLSDTFVVQ